MKIAVLHCNGSVGSWRWVGSVFGSIKKYYPKTEIKVFYKSSGTLPRDTLARFSSMGLQLVDCEGLFKPKKKRITNIGLIDSFMYWIRRINGYFISKKLIKKISSNDAVFDAWCFGSKAFNFGTKCFFIPHDFIFTHFFGLHCGNNYNRDFFEKTKKDIAEFLDYGYVPCVTSNYIAEELRKTYPGYAGKIHKIQVITESNMGQLDEIKCNDVLKKYGIFYDYVLLATNNMHHKNMEEALTAYYLVKQKYPTLKMIIVGYGTEGICVQMNTPFYADHVGEGEDYDIKSLGLVSDDELNVLLLKAKIVLNVSLCEAGCGSGLDAWSLGVPTVISDIPSYREQVETLGVKTEFCNPKNSEDIAAAMLRLLDDPKLAENNAKVSLEAFGKVHDTRETADAYMKVFEQYVHNDQLITPPY